MDAGLINLEPILDQLADIYFREEWWQSHQMNREQIKTYSKKMIEQGNLIYYEDAGKILGYCEFWKINFEQFGRIICHEKFLPYFEDVEHGQICYVANVWIDKNHRNTGVFKVLMHLFYKLNHHCEYYVGEAFRKKTAPVKVFKKADLKSKLFREGS